MSILILSSVEPSPVAPECSPAYTTAHRSLPVVWTAVCPHGRVVGWTATRVGTAADIACTCTCPEEAA